MYDCSVDRCFDCIICLQCKVLSDCIKSRSTHCIRDCGWLKDIESRLMAALNPLRYLTCVPKQGAEISWCRAPVQRHCCLSLSSGTCNASQCLNGVAISVPAYNSQNSVSTSSDCATQSNPTGIVFRSRRTIVKLQMF